MRFVTICDEFSIKQILYRLIGLIVGHRMGVGHVHVYRIHIRVEKVPRHMNPPQKVKYQELVVRQIRGAGAYWKVIHSFASNF